MNGTGNNGETVVLVPPGTFHMNDNWLNPDGKANGSPAYFTANGFGLEVTSGPDNGLIYTTFFDPGTGQYMGGCPGCGAPFTISDLDITPEIDPSSAMSALTLLSGTLVVIRGRRKKVTTIT